MLQHSNYFEHLRNPGIEDYSEPKTYPLDKIVVFDNRVEQIEIYTTSHGDRWAVGYNIRFADGRSAYNLPSFERGWFSSQRNAVLYFLGYLKTYANMFTPDAIAEVERLIPEYSQQRMF